MLCLSRRKQSKRAEHSQCGCVHETLASLARAAEMFGQFFLVLHNTSDIALRVLMPLYSHFLDTARFTSIEIEMLVVA